MCTRYNGRVFYFIFISVIHPRKSHNIKSYQQNKKFQTMERYNIIINIMSVHAAVCRDRNDSCKTLERPT